MRNPDPVARLIGGRNPIPGARPDRLLIEYGFLERTRSGREYWRAGTAPEG